MSAARVLSSLALAGVELQADGKRLSLVGNHALSPDLAAEVRKVAPRLLRVASGAWRDDLATWPAWRLDLYEERAAIRIVDRGLPADLAERLAYLDALEQPEPFGSLRPGPCPGCGASTLAVTGLGFCDGCGWAKLPAPIAGPAPRAPRAWAPAADDPLPPSKVPFHARPEVLADPARCRGCGARAVVAGQCQRCGCMAPRGLEPVEAAS